MASVNRILAGAVVGALFLLAALCMFGCEEDRPPQTQAHTEERARAFAGRFGTERWACDAVPGPLGVTACLFALDNGALVQAVCNEAGCRVLRFSCEVRSPKDET